MLSAVVASVPLIPSVDAAAVLPAICAIFLANLSLSIRSSFSFRFIAPGLLFKLLCRILALAGSKTSSVPPSSGRAFASDSRLATRFFEGLLRFLLLELGFSILETNVECLIIRLSFFVVVKPSLSSILVGVIRDREMEPEPDVAEEALNAGLLPLTGAYDVVRIVACLVWILEDYHDHGMKLLGVRSCGL